MQGTRTTLRQCRDSPEAPGSAGQEVEAGLPAGDPAAADLGGVKG